MSPNDSPARPLPDGVDAFLGRVRRRLLLRRLLRASLWGGTASLALLALVQVANRWFPLRLPVLEVGLPLFAVLGVRALLGTGRRRVAREADRELRLQDRLVSVLDFRTRTALDREFGAAQLRETARRLLAVDLRRELPIPRLSRLGPAVMLGALALTTLSPWRSVTRLPPLETERVGVLPPPEERPGAAGEDGAKPDPQKAASDAAKPSDEPAAAPAAATTDPSRAGAAAHEAPPRSEGEASAVPEPTGGPSPGPGHARAGDQLKQPAFLYSETVTKELTPVAAASSPRTRGTPAPALPRQLLGKVSFRVAPESVQIRGAAAAGSGAGGAAPLEVTVDFSQVPVAYREYVRLYFERLLRGEGG